MLEPQLIELLLRLYPEKITLNELSDRLSYEQTEVELTIKTLIKKRIILSNHLYNNIRLNLTDINHSQLEAKLKSMGLTPMIQLTTESMSTQIDAKENITNERLQDGWLFLTKKQTNSVGRLNRPWSSYETTNVAMTILLQPNLSYDELPLITHLFAQSYVKAMADILPLQIKWPNDIVYEGKKIAGILTELIFDDLGNPNIIVGIGSNLNSTPQFDNRELAGRASSIAYESKRTVETNTFIARLYQQIMKDYRNYVESKDASQFMANCRSFSAVIGKDVFVIEGLDKKQAYVHDINDSGELVIQYQGTSSKKTLLAGEISIRGLDGYI